MVYRADIRQYIQLRYPLLKGLICLASASNLSLELGSTENRSTSRRQRVVTRNDIVLGPQIFVMITKIAMKALR